MCMLTQDMHTHRQTSTKLLSDYCDGKFFDQHPLFSADPVALQLILYYDELELCNPLGSRRKKHKIGVLLVLHVATFTMHCCAQIYHDSQSVTLQGLSTIFLGTSAHVFGQKLATYSSCYWLSLLQ